MKATLLPLMFWAGGLFAVKATLCSVRWQLEFTHSIQVAQPSTWWQLKVCPDVAKCPLGVKSPLIQKCWIRSPIKGEVLTAWGAEEAMWRKGWLDRLWRRVRNVLGEGWVLWNVSDGGKPRQRLRGTWPTHCGWGSQNNSTQEEMSKLCLFA